MNTKAVSVSPSSFRPPYVLYIVLSISNGMLFVAGIPSDLSNFIVSLYLLNYSRISVILGAG
jgi:hypothetical protein